MGFNILSQTARNLHHDIWRDPHLAGFWPLNEGSSAVYDRQLTNRNNATALLGPTYGAAIGALTGMGFTKSASQEVRIGDVTALNFERTSPLTIIAAVKHNSFTSEQCYLSKADARGWYWEANSSGKPYYVAYSTGSTFTIVEANAALTTGVPYLLGVSLSGTTNAAACKLWQNGTTVAQTTVLDTLSLTIASTGAATIGQRLDTGFMDGSIGFVAVFNAEKTAIDMKRWARLGGFA